MSQLLKFIKSVFIIHLVVKVLVALGVGIISYSGFNLLLQEVGTYIQQLFSNLPVNVVGLIGLTDIDLVINLLLSAYSARVAMAQLTRFRVL